VIGKSFLADDRTKCHHAPHAACVFETPEVD